MADKEPVRFNIRVPLSSDAGKVKKLLEDRFPKMTLGVLDFRNLKMTLLSGSTDQKTYEQAFNAKIEWRVMPHQKLNPPRVVNIGQWVEVKKAQIPKYLNGLIRWIEVAGKLTTCD